MLVGCFASTERVLSCLRYPMFFVHTECCNHNFYKFARFPCRRGPELRKCPCHCKRHPLVARLPPQCPSPGLSQSTRCFHFRKAWSMHQRELVRLATACFFFSRHGYCTVLSFLLQTTIQLSLLLSLSLSLSLHVCSAVQQRVGGTRLCCSSSTFFEKSCAFG